MEVNIHCIWSRTSLQLKILETISRMFGNPIKMNTAYLSQKDEQSKSTVQTIKSMLRDCALEFEGNWDEYLPLMESPPPTVNTYTLGCYLIDLFTKENADLQYAKKRLVNESVGSRTDSADYKECRACSKAIISHSKQAMQIYWFSRKVEKDEIEGSVKLNGFSLGTIDLI